jgi:hypothetical protein
MLWHAAMWDGRVFSSGDKPTGACNTHVLLDRLTDSMMPDKIQR